MKPSDIRSAASRTYSNPDKTDDMLRRTLCDAADEIERLLEERPGLIMDKARLDFIQANHSWLTRSKDDAGTDHEWRVSLGMGQNTFDATTARGAIDAAMKETQ